MIVPLTRAVKTEAKKQYRCGFALTESELRRLHDLFVQQIKRTSAGDEFQANYEIKYRNGSVGYPASLDEVLAQENSGSASVLRFKMGVSGKGAEPSNMIGVQFSNEDEDEGGYYYPAIASVVLGEDRDWAFLTSSQLDERIAKIKLFALNQIVPRRTGLWTALGPAVALGLFLSAFLLATRRHNLEVESGIDGIVRRWKAGALRDPVDAVLQVAQVESRRTEFSRTEVGILIAAVSLPVVLLILGYSYQYFQPPYNFLWGDYVAVYDKRRSRGRFIFACILVASAVGVLVNFISKRLGL
jgi:hypothetical protein